MDIAEEQAFRVIAEVEFGETAMGEDGFITPFQAGDLKRFLNDTECSSEQGWSSETTSLGVRPLKFMKRLLLGVAVSMSTLPYAPSVSQHAFFTDRVAPNFNDAPVVYGAERNVQSSSVKKAGEIALASAGFALGLGAMWKSGVNLDVFEQIPQTFRRIPN